MNPLGLGSRSHRVENTQRPLARGESSFNTSSSALVSFRIAWSKRSVNRPQIPANIAVLEYSALPDRAPRLGPVSSSRESDKQAKGAFHLPATGGIPLTLLLSFRRGSSFSTQAYGIAFH